MEQRRVDCLKIRDKLTHWLVFWTFWWFSGLIFAKLALIWSKMHLHHERLPFLPLASCFMTFWLRHALKSKFWEFLEEKVTYVLRFFDFLMFFNRLSFFSFSLLFAVGIDLLMGLLGSSRWAIFMMEQPGVVAGNFATSFSLNFLSIFVFLCISRVPLGQSPWSGHHCQRDVFLLHKLSIVHANFSQKGWHQKLKKGRRSSRPVMAGTAVNGLMSYF